MPIASSQSPRWYLKTKNPLSIIQQQKNREKRQILTSDELKQENIWHFCFDSCGHFENIKAKKH